MAKQKRKWTRKQKEKMLATRQHNKFLKQVEKQNQVIGVDTEEVDQDYFKRRYYELEKINRELGDQVTTHRMRVRSLEITVRELAGMIIKIE